MKLDQTMKMLNKSFIHIVVFRLQRFDSGQDKLPTSHADKLTGPVGIAWCAALLLRVDAMGRARHVPEDPIELI